MEKSNGTNQVLSCEVRRRGTGNCMSMSRRENAGTAVNNRLFESVSQFECLRAKIETTFMRE
jgi:hypothetical protein